MVYKYFTIMTFLLPSTELIEERKNVPITNYTKENLCNLPNKIPNRCRFGLFTCNDGSCIPQTYICDGYIDCPCADDETNCKCDVTDLSTMASACFKGHHLPELTIEKYSNNSSVTISCLNGSYFLHDYNSQRKMVHL